MNIIAQLAIFSIQELIAHAPGLYVELQALFSKQGTPTAADWEALRAKVRAKSYSDYDPSLNDPAQIALALLPTPALTKAAESASAGAAVPAPAASQPVPLAAVREQSLGGEAVREQSLGVPPFPASPADPAKPA